MARRLKRGAVTFALTGLLISSCGVPTQSEPRRVNRRDVPFGLLKPPKSATTTTTNAR